MQVKEVLYLALTINASGGGIEWLLSIFSQDCAQDIVSYNIYLRSKTCGAA